MSTKYEYNDTEVSDLISVSGDEWLCHTFTPQITHYLNMVKLFLFTYEVGGDPEPSSDVVVGIRNTTGDDNHPDGTDRTSATFLRTELTTDEAGEWKEIALPKYRVVKDTTYAIVLRIPDIEKGEVVGWRFSVDGDTYPRGVVGISEDGGVTWDMEIGAEYDFLFEEWGDPVVAHRHHPTIPNEPNIGRILSGMGSLKTPKVRVAGYTYTVKTGTLVDSTAFNGKRSLARKSNGDLWCVYSRSDGTTNQIYCAYSTDGGKTWTEEQITNQTVGNDQCHPSIAIDSKDYIHIVWIGFGWGNNTGGENIQYRERTTSWQTQEEVTDIGFTQDYPSIAIDSNDNIYVVWTGTGWGTNNYNIQYREKTTAGWQTQEAVTEIGLDQVFPAIAIDSNDYVHVVWMGQGWGNNPSNFNIQYRERTASWQTQEEVTDIGFDQYYPAIVIDSSDNTHVAWVGPGWGNNTSAYNIQYRERTTSWQIQEAVTDTAYDQQYSCPSIAVDSASNVHIVWAGLGWGTNTNAYNIQYRERTTSWQAQVGITDLGYENNYPILIWALHPTVSTLKTNIPKTGYALVWSGQDVDGYKVEYFASDDLSWET